MNKILILIILLISSSAWAQKDIMESVKFHNSKYATRIDVVYKFLEERNLHNGSFTWSGRLDGEIRVKSYTKNGRTIVALMSDKPETEKKVNINNLNEIIQSTILNEQLSGMVLTDVLNLGNDLFVKTKGKSENSRIIQEVKLGTESGEFVFKGPLAILVMLNTTEQLYLEDIIFKSILIEEFSQRFGADEKFKDAYEYLQLRRDFRNSLLVYTKIQDPYIQDRDLAEMMMTWLQAEFNSEEISEKTVYMLSNKSLLSFLEDVYKVEIDLKPFYNFVKEWQKYFAELSLNEIHFDYEENEKPEEIVKARTDFYERMENWIGNYIRKYPDRPSFKVK